MRSLLIALTFSLTFVTSASAQGAADEDTDFGQLFGELLGRIDPYFGQLTELLGDLSGWHAPEVLPNGDILIRRRQVEDLPEEPSPEDAPSEDEAPVLDPLEL